MALFGLETEKSEKVLSWFSETIKRGESDNLVKNPFKIRAKFFLDEKLLIVMDIKPVWPNVTIFGWITFFALIFIWGANWFLLPAGLIGCLGFFWTSPFYYFMAIKGIRKAGYNGPIRFVRHREIIKEVVL